MLHAGNRQAAVHFMKSHMQDFSLEAERDFLEELSSVFSIQDIELRPLVNAFRMRKYKVDLSDEAHIILQKFLAKHGHVILMQVRSFYSSYSTHCFCKKISVHLFEMKKIFLGNKYSLDGYKKSVRHLLAS